MIFTYSTLCPQSTLLCFVRISERTFIIIIIIIIIMNNYIPCTSLSKWFSQPRYSLNIARYKLNLYMKVRLIRRPFIMKYQDQFQASSRQPWGVPVSRSGTRTGFSFSTLGFPCQYHCTNAAYSSASTCCSYQMDEAWRIVRKECSFGDRETLDRKELSLSF